MTRLMVPRSRIPKIFVRCVRCEDGKVKTTISVPFAAGYHRRHVCQDCTASFYSLTPYDGNPPDIQATPFEDRELTSYEEYQRLQMWKDEAAEMSVTFEVKLITRLNAALHKSEKERTDVERYIVAAYHALEKKVREFEDQHDGV